MEITRPTVMEVDINAFKYNIEKIREYTNNQAEIMPVIKGNAYGTFLNTKLDVLNEFNIVAVAIVDEGVNLRNIGYEKDILILNPPCVDELDKIEEYGLITNLSSDSLLDEIIKSNRKIRVHLEIGTGMGRTGINPKRVQEYGSKMKECTNISVEGIFTHLSSADVDKEYTLKQLESFSFAYEEAKKVFGKIKYAHCAASNGILNFTDNIYNLIRPGIIMYGYESYEGALDKIELKPVCKLKSKITYLKEVEPGYSIGYSRSYITSKRTKVATIPIGYADGLKRVLSNKGTVVINGQKVNIIGNVCMDGFMADVTDLDVKVGDDVYIWDNKIQTLEDIASQAGTINYEFLCTISNRVPRRFI